MSIMTADAVHAVEAESSTADIPTIARYLQEQLGQKMVAYLSGVRDPKMVGRWARGKHHPRPDTLMRLRKAYEVTRLLVDAYDAETAKAWLMGSNSRLDDEAPAYLLRYAETLDDVRLVVPVARAFAGGRG